MDKKSLVKFLDGIFLPLGVKRKGNYWVHNGEEIAKIINLQKSNFGNFFYINYGFIIRGLTLEGLKAHVDYRLASSDPDENQRIVQLLDIESNIADDERFSALKLILMSKLVPRLQAVSTEADLLQQLKDRPHLYDVPLIVKRHFQLDLE